MAAAEGKPVGSLRLPPTALVIGAAVIYGLVAFTTLFDGRTWTEEVVYLVKSWWYASGAVKPYTAADATWHMPLYFYVLGFWQQLEGIGHIPGRLMSIGLGMVSAILLFAICRRLTANSLAAAAAVFIFLGTPATAYYFATATPAAAASALHLLAVWMVVANMGRQRVWATAIMGLVCVALFFTSQNMILAVIALAPLYVAAIGRKRLLHAAVLLAVMAAATAGVLYSFPEKLAHHALRLPVIAPWLESIMPLSPNFTLIDSGTIGAATLAPSFDRIAPMDFVEAFLLPYGGTLLLALWLFFIAKGPLRILWVVPLYFLWLVAGHFLASPGYCGRCIISYTPYFASIGALAAALTLAMFALRARRNQLPPEPFVLVAALVVAALNMFGPTLAQEPGYKFFPLPRMADVRPASEVEDMEALARWLTGNTPAKEPLLVIHSLGATPMAGLPYAAFLSGHPMPTQSLNLAESRRVINPKLSAQARESVQAAIEEESLWTDDTMRRWIAREYDWILLQDDSGSQAYKTVIVPQFDVAGTTVYRGASVILYKRKPVQ